MAVGVSSACADATQNARFGFCCAPCMCSYLAGFQRLIPRGRTVNQGGIVVKRPCRASAAWCVSAPPGFCLGVRGATSIYLSICL